MSEKDRDLPGRREFVVGSLGAVTLASAACGDDVGTKAESPAPGDGGVRELEVDDTLFAHGVASGDPLIDRVILWTRVTRDAEAPVTVRWLIASDAALADVVNEGEVETDADQDYTVKVDADGLSADTTYYYAFAVGSKRSVTGRTKTLPGADAEHVRLAYTSCANFNNGYFHAYGNIAKRDDLDVWIHLGDFIYEYAEGVYGDPTLGRTNDPLTETITLSDYRTRYSQYRKDENLKELSRQLPCIAIWDDHEFANNANKDGAENHDEATEGPWDERKRAGARAFLEWLPIRVTDTGDVPKIYRSFAFGELFDLIMLDTRLIGRDIQAGYDDEATGKGDPAVWADPTRQLLGEEQEEWFKDALTASNDRGAAYRLIGNQIIISPTRDPRATREPLYADFWDGYEPARARIFDHILDNGIHDVVFLTGDIHTSWAMEVARDPFDPSVYDPATGEGAFAVEIVGPSVTSLALEDDPLAGVASGLIAGVNPHVKFSEVTQKGYVLVDVTVERVTAEWYYVQNHKLEGADGAEERRERAYTMERGSAHLVEADAPSDPKDSVPLAP